MREVEKGVPLREFEDSMLNRDLDAEFRLVRKLTETRDHTLNQICMERKVSQVLNRYQELKPCKFTARLTNLLALYFSFTHSCAVFTAKQHPYSQNGLP